MTKKQLQKEFEARLETIAFFADTHVDRTEWVVSVAEANDVFNSILLLMDNVTE